jgi:hypothetical protein
MLRARTLNHTIELLESRRLFSTVFASVGTQPVGPLTGKIVYAAAGHGLAASSAGVWNTGRGETNEMVEDLGNYDQHSLYVDELWRAGATVVPLRPVGHQLNEVIVDNQQATYTGTWTDDASTPYFSTTNGSGVHYRTAVVNPAETAVATFTPNIPATGFYPVYAWAADGATRATDQLYRVNHAGGSTEVKVNQQRVGKGWVYLGTYYFRAGQGGSVSVSNKSLSGGPFGGGAVVVADAIRFGNGMGSVVRNGLTSGSAREDEASIYWVEAQAGWTGVGTRVSSTNWRSSTTSDDESANVSAPLRWAEYMNAAPLGQSVYLSFHSNAGGGRGTVGLYNRDDLFPGTATPNQLAWAGLTGNEVNDDMVAWGSPPLEFAWFNRNNATTARSDYAFGEIRGDTNGDEFDATIVEVAFHDDPSDAALLRDPVVRQRIAQSTAQATIRYFNQFGGGNNLTFLPEKPTNLRTSLNTSGDVVLNWNASVASPIFGGAATSYRIHASRDGYSFDGGIVVAGTTLTIPKSLIGSGTVYFKVVGINAGGESPATAVVAARVGDSRFGRVLIVDGFDRLGRAQDPTQTIAISGVNSNGNQTTPVTIDRVRPRDSNSFDYAVQHAQAIANYPSALGVDTVDNLAVINGNVNLANYRAVIWISGEESTADDTFNATEQSKVTTYLNGGGKMFVSGSELGWDLVGQAGGSTFFNSALHSGYTSDSAGTYAAAGVVGSIFNGISLGFDNGTGGTYNVNSADRLAASNGSTAVLNYSGGSGGVAATLWKAATGGAATIVMGIPFETITTSAARALLMRRALDTFGFTTFAPTPPSLPLPMQPPIEVSPKTPLARKPDGRGSIAASILA